jgi:CheY-like chemotaxis protein
MDGYKGARRIKSHPEMKEVPIIAVTSNALADDDAKALRACSCHVAKPYSPRALLAKVREYLALCVFRFIDRIVCIMRRRYFVLLISRRRRDG